MQKLKPKTISQIKIRRYLELKELAKEFETLKGELKTLARAGMVCQSGRYVLNLNTAITTSVAWKQEYIKELGQCKADEVMDQYRGNSVRMTIVVTDSKNVMA